VPEPITQHVGKIATSFFMFADRLFLFSSLFGGDNAYLRVFLFEKTGDLEKIGS